MPDESKCWSCQSAIDPPDNYCRRCGMGQAKCLPWYYHPAWIIVLALFALGPLVLPLIWRTPKLETRGRVIGTVLIAALTWYLVYAFLKAVQMLKAVLLGAF